MRRSPPRRCRKTNSRRPGNVYLRHVTTKAAWLSRRAGPTGLDRLDWTRPTGLDWTNWTGWTGWTGLYRLDWTGPRDEFTHKPWTRLRPGPRLPCRCWDLDSSGCKTSVCRGRQEVRPSHARTDRKSDHGVYCPLQTGCSAGLPGRLSWLPVGAAEQQTPQQG